MGSGSLSFTSGLESTTMKVLLLVALSLSAVFGDGHEEDEMPMPGMGSGMSGMGSMFPGMGSGMGSGMHDMHDAVLVFVVQLQQLHVVGVGSLAVGGLQGLLDLGDDVVELGELLALFVGLAKADAHLLGGVVAHGVHDVAEEVEVELALAIPVVDVTDLLNSISVNHFVCCGGASLSAVDKMVDADAVKKIC